MPTTATYQKEANIQKLSVILNKQVANMNVLFTKLHNYHWYVKGEAFFTLHAKFEELYNEAAAHLDEFAERLLALGGEPVATMKQCLETSSIKEASGDENAEKMVETLHSDFEKIVIELREGIEIAQNNHDEVTADMLLGLHKSLETEIWMFRAFLGK